MHPTFGLVATVIAGVLFAYALLVEPWWGRRVHRRLVRLRDEDPRVLVRTFRLTIAAQLAWSVLVLLAVVTATDLPARDLGLRMPAADPLAYGLLGALAVSVLASVFVQRAIARRAATGNGPPPAVPDAIAVMLPRTTAERWYAAAVAVTAGVCEELLFRGFFVAAGTGPGRLPVVAAAVVSLVVFTLAHIYQGGRQLIAVTALAVAFTVLYLRSGSLLPPVAAHVLIDLQGLLVTSRTVMAARER